MSKKEVVSLIRQLGNLVEDIGDDFPAQNQQSLPSSSSFVDSNFRWKCSSCNCTGSVRQGSFFTRSKLPLKNLVLLMYHWAVGTPQNVLRHELQLMSNHTSVDWYNFMRDICCFNLRNNPQQIGGITLDEQNEIVPITVEIDESKFFHRKYHRGQYREGNWVFGGIERQTGKCFLVIVENRNAATLKPLIEEWILPGSHIISDGWAAYNNINRLNGHAYTHSVVIHQNHFVDPVEREIHTNNVESMWSRAKRVIRNMYGTSEALFPSYLVEFMWRQRFNDKAFANILLHTAEMYPI